MFPTSDLISVQSTTSLASSFADTLGPKSLPIAVAESITVSVPDCFTALASIFAYAVDEYFSSLASSQIQTFFTPYAPNSPAADATELPINNASVSPSFTAADA